MYRGKTQQLSSLVGKHNSCRHFTMSFSKNITVVKTNYQMLEVLSFFNRERA